MEDLRLAAMLAEGVDPPGIELRGPAVYRLRIHGDEAHAPAEREQRQDHVGPFDECQGVAAGFMNRRLGGGDDGFVTAR